MSGFKLYEISSLLQQAYEAADAAINADTGEMTPDWSAFLETVEMERTEKIEHVACLLKSISSESDAIKSEELALRKRRQALDNKYDRIKTWLSQFVSVGEKIKTARVAIGWTTSHSVDILNPAEVPDDMCKIEKTPVKTLIKDFLSSFPACTWARIVEKKSITIK